MATSGISVLEYLAEVTMAVLAQQRQRAPGAGYATDFVTSVIRPLVREIAPPASISRVSFGRLP